MKILIGDKKFIVKSLAKIPHIKTQTAMAPVLLTFASNSNLNLVLPTSENPQKTWRSPKHYLGECKIDHVTISHGQYKIIHDIQVRRGTSIDSYYYLVRYTNLRMGKNCRKTTPTFATKLLRMLKNWSHHKLAKKPMVEFIRNFCKTFANKIKGYSLHNLTFKKQDGILLKLLAGA